jgi:hypothetical protein
MTGNEHFFAQEFTALKNAEEWTMEVKDVAITTVDTAVIKSN